MFCVNDIFALALRFVREIDTDKKWKRQVQRVVCSSLVVHKYIDRRIISRDETLSECENVISKIHNE